MKRSDLATRQSRSKAEALKEYATTCSSVLPDPPADWSGSLGPGPVFPQTSFTRSLRLDSCVPAPLTLIRLRQDCCHSHCPHLAWVEMKGVDSDTHCLTLLPPDLVLWGQVS